MKPYNFDPTLQNPSSTAFIADQLVGLCISPYPGSKFNPVYRFNKIGRISKWGKIIFELVGNNYIRLGQEASGSVLVDSKRNIVFILNVE